MTSFPLQFAAHAPNRWQFTTGPADGEYPLIRMTGPEMVTGVDGPVPDPPVPVPAFGEGIKVDLWPTGDVVG